MNEKERTMVPEFNPYDLLTEPETKPVKSPVILGNAGKPEKKIQGENAMEIIPLASKAIYNKIPLKEWNTVDTINFEIEEDILVPDTFPDMEMILNMDANAGPSEVNNEGEYTEIKGRIKIIPSPIIIAINPSNAILNICLGLIVSVELTQNSSQNS